VKAALLLLPLLGLTNLLNMLDAPLEKSAWVFGFWSYSTHLLTSSQGFILACLYCYKNQEVSFHRVNAISNPIQIRQLLKLAASTIAVQVQHALKKYFRNKVLRRNKVMLPNSSVRMTLLNNSPTVHNNEIRVTENPTDIQQTRLMSPKMSTSTIVITKKQGSNKSKSHRGKRNNNNLLERAPNFDTPSSEIVKTTNKKTSNIDVSDPSMTKESKKPLSGHFQLLLITNKNRNKRSLGKDQGSAGILIGTCEAHDCAQEEDEEESMDSICVPRDEILREVIIEEDEEIEVTDNIVVLTSMV
jgi:hypothetical protein